MARIFSKRTKKIPSRNQYLVIENFPLGDRFTSEDVSKLLGVSHASLGGVMSSLERAGYVKAIYRKTRNNTVYEREIGI
jgi:Mn-dependent DtxR family transcriptional regulator